MILTIVNHARFGVSKMRLIIAAIIFSFLAQPVFADSRKDVGSLEQPMNFLLVGNGGNCSTCMWIAAIPQDIYLMDFWIYHLIYSNKI